MSRTKLSVHLMFLGLFHAALASAQTSPLNAADQPVDLSLWNPQFADLCLLPPYSSAQTAAQNSLRALIASLSSAAAPEIALLEHIHENGPAFCIIEDAGKERGYFDPEFNLIALKNQLTFAEKQVIAIHELQHLDQYTRGFCPSTDYDIEEMVRFTYALEADAQAITTLYVWSMKENGNPAPWEAMLAFEKYGDIAASFQQAVLDGAEPTRAIEVAFAQWFESDWRREAYNLSACMDYLNSLDHTKLLRSYDLLPEGIFEDLCRLPDGTPYSCQDAAENAPLPE